MKIILEKKRRWNVALTLVLDPVNPEIFLIKRKRKTSESRMKERNKD